MSLTLCLIVKNEMSFLPGCLAAARPFVDEIVIVDTGSTDGTIDVAREAANTVSLHEFDGDFSAARNLALEGASSEWILFLDADERVLPEQMPSLVSHLARISPDIWGLRLLRYNFFATGGFYTGRELRVFRNRAEVRYQRKINESVAGSIANAGAVVAPAPVVFNHFGHTRPLAVRTQKAHRYLALMNEQLAAAADPVLLGYQGLILRTLGRFGEALECSLLAVEAAPSSATVWLFRGHVLRSTGADAAALAAYLRGLEAAPDSAALHNMAGVQLTVLGERSQAAHQFTEAQRLDPQLLHTDINLGLLAQADGAWEEAIALFTRAGRRNPGFFHDEWAGRIEQDPYRPFYYETIPGYAGLGYHLGYCLAQVAGRVESSGR